MHGMKGKRGLAKKRNGSSIVKLQEDTKDEKSAYHEQSNIFQFFGQSGNENFLKEQSNTFICMKENLLSSACKEISFIHELKDLLTPLQVSDSCSVVDFCFKYFRKVIDELEKTSENEFDQLLFSCEYVCDCLSTILKQPNPVLTEEMYDKAMKILFHVLKHFYRKSCLTGMTKISSVVIQLLISALGNGIEIKIELKKMFFTMHQMTFSVYTKSLQTIIKNKSSDVTELFVFRTSSLIILSFSEWKKNNFIGLINDYFKRWMKILTNLYKFNADVAFEILLELIKCIGHLVLGDKTLQLHNVLWDAVFLSVVIGREEDSNRKRLLAILSKIKTLFPVMKTQMNFLSSSCGVDKILSSLNHSKLCICEHPDQEHLSNLTELLPRMLSEEQDCEKLCRVVSFFNRHLKDQSIRCVKIIEMFRLLAWTLLSSDVLVQDLEALQLDAKKQRLASLCMFALHSLRDIEYLVAQDAEKVEKCESLRKNKDQCKSFSSYFKVLETFVANKVEDMELQYLKCLWASCYKIGMKYYQQEQTDLSLEALSLAYHMKTLNNSLESIDNILQHLKETCSISSALASSHCQKKNYKESYNFLVKNFRYIINLSADIIQYNEFEKLLQVQLDRLVNVKFQLYDSWKCDKKRNDLLYRCLRDEVSDCENHNSIWLLVARFEYDIYEKHSQRCNVYPMLKKLIEIQKNIHEENGDLLDYSFTMVKLSTLPGCDRKERFYWCKEAIGMLEGMLETLTGDVMEFKIRDALALSYFQEAVILYEEKVERSLNIADDSCNNVINKCVDHSLNISSELLDVFQLNDELESDFVMSMNNALEMWLKVVQFIKFDQNKELIGYFYDITYSAQCLKQAAVLYSLQSQNFQAMQAAYLSGYFYHCLDEVGEQISSWTFLATQLLCVESVEVGEWVLQNLVQPTDHVLPPSLKMDTVTAAYLIKKGEMEKSMELLKNIFTDATMDVNTRTTLLLKSDAFYLLSLLKLHPAASKGHEHEDIIQFTDKHFPTTSPFPPALDCIKYLRSLFETNLESDKYDMFSCWLILDKLLISLMTHAELLEQQGSIMEARSYLKEALLLSRKYHLPFRVLEIIEKICGIDILLENASSFDNNFKALCTILNNSVSNCFHDDTIYLPDFVSHTPECSCTYCSNPKLQESHVQLYLQYINGRMTFSDTSPDDETCTKAIDDLTHNANVRFYSCLNSVKCLIGYDHGVDTALRKKKKKLKNPQNEEVPMFSKYITKAKVFSKDAIKYSSSMLDTIEQLISKLEIMKQVENAQHDFQRLMAQLYYLRRMIYLGSDKHKHHSSYRKVVAENNELDCDNQSVAKRGKTVQRKTKSRKARNTKTMCSVKGRANRDPQSSEEQLVNEIQMMDLKDKEIKVKGNPGAQSLLSDLKKVLPVLNSYTDTLIIKSIYQLISLMTSEDNKQLAISSHFLSYARTLHQQVLQSVGKKLRKRNDTTYTLPLREERKLLGTAELIEVYSKPDFVFSGNNLESVVKEIPADWTVCSLTLSQISKDQFMVISRVKPDNESCLVKIKLNDSGAERTSIVCDLASAFHESIESKFHSILEESKASMTIKDKKAWWNERRRLDYRMKSLVSRMENEWLRGWKGMLLGDPVNQFIIENMENLSVKIVEEIKRKVNVSLDVTLVTRLAEGFEHCSKVELLDSFQMLCGGRVGEEACEVYIKLCEDNLKLLENGTKSSNKRKPVVLILDKVLQSLPWESIPILRNQPVVRMPSILLTSSHCMNNKELLKNGLSAKNVFYVLNPKNDLKRTEDMFVDWFESEKWSGIVGKPPTSEEYTHALTQNDLFLYCGHGSGQEYLGWDVLQRLQCKAVALLMGCSSGKLVSQGMLEARGMAQYYILAGSPAVVANLWDVTDKDIDLFLETLLKIWLTESSGRNLADCVTEARQACKLEYLIGAAPVIYGLPLFTKKRKT